MVASCHPITAVGFVIICNIANTQSLYPWQSSSLYNASSLCHFAVALKRGLSLKKMIETSIYVQIFRIPTKRGKSHHDLHRSSSFLNFLLFLIFQEFKNLKFWIRISRRTWKMGKFCFSLLYNFLVDTYKKIMFCEFHHKIMCFERKKTNCVLSVYI